jgi:hypothetical protein
MAKCIALRLQQQHSINGILIAPQTTGLREQNLLFIFISAFLHRVAIETMCLAPQKPNHVSRMHKVTL